MTPEIKPIRSDADHTVAMREIKRLWGADPGTPEGDRLDVLVTLAAPVIGGKKVSLRVKDPSRETCDCRT